MNVLCETDRGAASAAGGGGDQTFLLVGSRVGDSVFTVSRPGRPGFSGSPGSIRLYRIDGDQVNPMVTVTDAIRVGGSLLDPSTDVIHVTHEVSSNATFYPPAHRGGGGEVLTYRIERDGRLSLADRTLAYGARPADLGLAAGHRFVLTANLGGGLDGGGPCTTAEFDADGHLHPQIHTTEHSVVCRRRRDDGTLGDVVDVLTSDAGLVGLVGDPTDTGRVACCSTDGRVRLLHVDPDDGRVTVGFAFDLHEGSAGTGPVAASVVFHPGGRWLYARRGLSPRITHVDLQAERPQVIGSYAAAPTADASSAAGPAPLDEGYARGTVVAGADGRHLYVVLAAEQDARAGSIAVLELDPHTGQATPVQLLDHPPGASAGCGVDISPDGRRLAVPCPVSGEVVMFDVGADGLLTVGCRFDQPAAAHARFYDCPTQRTRPVATRSIAGI